MQSEQMIGMLEAGAAEPLLRLPASRREVGLAARATKHRSAVPQQFFAWLNRLARDSQNGDPASFPFALVVSAISSIGMAVIGWGALLASAWLLGAGFLLTLVGSGLFGLGHGGIRKP